MNQDEIIEMAKQVGMIKDGEWWFSSFYKTEQDVHINHLEDFANLVAQHEREECAKACENIYSGEEACGDWPTPEMCAEAIRERSNK
jgi:hypothetical protein